MTEIQRKETEIGTIPQEWEVGSIGENCDLLTGFPFKGNMYDDKEGIRVLRGENVSLGFIRRDSDKKRKHDTSDLNKYFLQDLDLVVGMDGSRVGRNRAMIKVTDLPLLLAQRVARIRAKGNLDQKFLSYQILHEQFEEFVDKLKTGTSIPHISGDQLKSYPIILPPLPEQQAIASTLGSLDDKIELLREQNKTLEAMGQAIFKEWFGKYDIEDELPEGWRVGKLGELGEFKNGINYSRDDGGDMEYKVISVKALSNSNRLNEKDIESTLLESKKANNYLLDIGDIVIARSASPGSCVLITDKIDNIVYSGFAIRLKPKDCFRSNYLFWTLKNDKERIINAGSGTIFTNINQQILINHGIIIPSIKSLEEFNYQMQNIIDKITQNNQQIQALIQSRDSLLPRLMSGKVRFLV